MLVGPLPWKYAERYHFIRFGCDNVMTVFSYDLNGPVRVKSSWRMWVKIDKIYHYGDVIMGIIASQITSLTIVYSTIYSGADQRKHQSSTSQAFVRWIHRGPVNSTHKWPVTRKMFPFDDVSMSSENWYYHHNTTKHNKTGCILLRKYIMSNYTLNSINQFTVSCMYA